MTKKTIKGARAVILRVSAAVATVLAIASPAKSNTLSSADSKPLTIEQRVTRVRENLCSPLHPDDCSKDAEDSSPPGRLMQWNNWPNWNNWRNWRNAP